MINMSFMEVNLTRPFLLRGMDELLDLQGGPEKDSAVAPAGGASDRSADLGPAAPAVRQRT